jgi:uncharacterized membrane protein YgcG
MRIRTAPIWLVVALAALTACSSPRYVTVAGKTQKCVNLHSGQVVSEGHCQGSNQTPSDAWYYLFFMNNGSTYNVPPQIYNTTPVGKQLDEDDEDLDDEVDENGNSISEAPSDDQDGSSSNDEDNGGDSGSDGDDGGDSGGDDGGGGDD